MIVRSFGDLAIDICRRMGHEADVVYDLDDDLFVVTHDGARTTFRGSWNVVGDFEAHLRRIHEEAPS